MSKYEEKKQARIERFKQYSEKALARSEQAFSESGKISGMIPMGQPILVGHHSERRHRRNLEKIHAKMERGFKEREKADYYASRAESAENNRQIDSDDPEAVRKIKEKIEGLEKSNALMKAANKIVRDKKLTKEEKAASLRKLTEGTKIKDIETILEPDFAGRLGFAHFILANNSAEIRRLKKRLVALSRIDKFEAFNVGEISVDVVEAQIQVRFPYKPSDEVRAKLKRDHGLKWSRYETAWVRKFTGQDEYYFGKLKITLETSEVPNE